MEDKDKIIDFIKEVGRIIKEELKKAKKTIKSGSSNKVH